MAFCHLLAAVLPTVLALGTVNLAHVILLEAGLSYLGLGLPPPWPSLEACSTKGVSS